MAECAYCGKEFAPKRSSAMYCSNACRMKAYRERSKTQISVTQKPGRAESCLNEEARISIPTSLGCRESVTLTCPTCGREFAPKKPQQKYCSRSCAGRAKIAKAQKARREAMAKNKRNLLGIENPLVYRFTIRNCDYCANHMQGDCPSPRENILRLRWADLPKPFREIIKSGECPYAEFRIWNTTCDRYDNGKCIKGIRSCDGCAYKPSEVVAV